MLVKKLIPMKYLALIIEIILAALLLATRTVYPDSGSASSR